MKRGEKDLIINPKRILKKKKKKHRGRKASTKGRKGRKREALEERNDVTDSSRICRPKLENVDVLTASDVTPLSPWQPLLL